MSRYSPVTAPSHSRYRQAAASPKSQQRRQQQNTGLRQANIVNIVDTTQAATVLHTKVVLYLPYV
jgi:hypothetical protein